MPRLFLLAFIWGWSFFFIKVAGEGLTPSAVAWGRIALGAIVLNAVLARRGRRLPVSRTMLRHYAVCAVAGNVIPFTLLTYAENHITSALTAVLNASTPLFTALFAAVALSERLRRLQVVGLAVGVVGVAVAAGFGVSDLTGGSLWGSLAAAAAGAGYGLAFVYIRKNLMGVPPLTAAAGQLAAGAALYWPVAVATSLTDGFELTPTRALAMVMLGLFGTGIAYLLSYRIIADLGPTTASLVTYIIPVVAVIVGIVVLDEPFEWRLVLGGGLTVLGVAAVNHKPPVPAPTPTAAATPAGATTPAAGQPPSSDAANRGSPK